MKSHRKTLIAVVSAAVLLAPLGAFAKKKEMPEISEDGLHKVQKPKDVDAAYTRPGVDFSVYNTVKVLEPYIAFRKDWKDNQNSSRPTNKISNRDMEKMVSTGKELFAKEFKKVLEKEGYPVVDEIASDTLIVRPAIINLDVYAPDPNNMNGIWNKVYTDGAGQATLYVELFDGPSSQILAKAFDHKDGSMGPSSWRMPRTRSSNTNDARNAMNDWAHALVNGLERAKEQKAE
jgi:hypothetical protein